MRVVRKAAPVFVRSDSGVGKPVYLVESVDFPPERRLRRPQQFTRVFAQARRIASAGFVLLYCGNDLDYCRLGLAISKKHIKQAVHRNRVKRIIREFFRISSRQISGLDIVVVSRAAATQLESPQVWQQLETVWKKLLQRCEQHQ